MSLRTTLTAAAALLLSSTASAHMIMSNPVPFSVDKIDNSPITASQYPCKSQLGFTVSTMNNMKVGDEQSLSFKGSAIHGGGSCQLSITTDKTPTANSKFKVIQSYEGGCPGVDSPLNFTYKIPDSIPSGQVTLAWTWFSRLAGQPELYMNCAPVTVSGGASDTSKFDSLPDMLVANIATAQCTTVANLNVKFPNPGQNLLVNDAAASAALPTGSGCGKAVSGSSGSSTGGASQATTAPAVASSAASSAAAVSSATNSGGVFAPGASSAAATAAQSTFTTLVTLTSAAQSVPAAATSQAAVGTGVTSAGSASPSGSTGGSTCTTNGAVVCNGPNQFGLCNNGNVVWQQVAAGTTCSNGQISKRHYVRQLKGRLPRPRILVGEDF